MFSQSLFRKYALVIMSLVGGLLVFGAAIELVFNYRETRAQIELLQKAEARAAAARIAEFLRAIERQVRDVSSLPWAEGAMGEKDRLEEYRRLLKLVPAITEVRAVDTAGRETLRVSRQTTDEIGSGRDSGAGTLVAAAFADGSSYGPTFFKYGSEPFLQFAVRDRPAVDRPARQVTIVELNLKFAGDVVRDIHPGRNAQAYVIDVDNHLVSHPNLSYVLRRSDLSTLPQVAAMRNRAQTDAVVTLSGQSIDGQDVLAAFAPVGVAGWWVVVEQPAADALRPVYGTLLRTGLLFLLGILIALAASYVLAHRLAAPILTVQRGAARIGRGELDTRIHVKTNDEVEVLAHEFNTMAGKLQESHSGLEQKIADKTAELIAANRHKSEFLANMSHELRTPLNAVIGFSDVLREQYFGQLNQKQMEYVRDINTSGQHLLSLINDILDLSKIEAGRMDLDLTRFNLPASVDNALVLLRDRAMRQNIKLKADIGEGVDDVVADERKVKQILINLLSNAVKFSHPHGWVQVVATRGTNETLMTVKDTGMGIAPEDQGAVFEAFHQLRASGSAKQEGTGLGLSLARRLTEVHGGRIWVESAVGEGAAFTFTLPDRDLPAET